MRATPAAAGESIAVDSPNVITLFHVSPTLQGETFELLEQAIFAASGKMPLVIAHAGDILVEPTNLSTARRTVPNTRYREDRTIVKGLTMAIEVHVTPSRRFRLAAWTASTLAHLMARVTGIPCEVHLVPTTEGA